MKLLFVGDCVIQDANKYSIAPEVVDYIKEHDYRICNFEGAIAYTSDKKN